MRHFAIGLAAFPLLAPVTTSEGKTRDCAYRAAEAPALPERIAETAATVMIDGVISPGEWEDAVGRGRVRIKRSASHLYVAAAFPEAAAGFADLFVTACGQTHALHASAKLGELRVTADPADWVWWNNAGWVANTTRVDSFERRTFLPAPVREFQIALAKFPGRLWGLRLELTETGPDGRPAGPIDLPMPGEWLLDLGESPGLAEDR